MKLSAIALKNINNSDYGTIESILSFNIGDKETSKVIESYGSYSNKRQWADSLCDNVIEILERVFK